MSDPNSPAAFTTKSNGLGAGFGVAILVAFCLVSAYWLFDQAARSAAFVNHAFDVKRTTNDLLTLTVDAETGQRGFLLTGDRIFLEPYLNAQATIPGKLETLMNLTRDNPRQIQLLAAATRTINERMQSLQRSVERMEKGDQESFITAMRTGRGKEMQDQIRHVLREVLDEEHRVLAVRESDVEQKRLLSLLPLFMALLGLGWLAWQDTQRNRRQIALLQEYNLKLDTLVQEKTADLQRERSRVEALLRDVTHRVGNNLAMIAALLNIQRRRVDDERVQQALEEVAIRIQAMSAAQRRMNLDIETDEVEGKPYLENLIAELRQTVGDRNIRIETDFADIRLPGKEAVSYIILVNELVTNAIKHAFPGGMPGKIKVAMREDRSNGQAIIIIAVEDDGVGSAGDHGKGLGKTVLRSLLQSLNGTLTREQVAPGETRPGHRVTMCLPRNAYGIETDAAPERNESITAKANPEKVI